MKDLNSKKYTAVVCAAGQGKRLSSLTVGIPKPLVLVGKKKIMEYMLDNFSDCGLTDVVIVVGYKGDVIERELGDRHGNCAISYVCNKDFEITDNLYSMYLAKEKIKNGMIFFNADIIFNKHILDRSVRDARSNSLVTSSISVGRAGKNAVWAKINEKGMISDLEYGAGEQCEQEVFGIYKLSPEATMRYFEIADDFFKDGPRKGGFWWPIKQTAFEIPFYAVPAPPDKWVSINNIDEYNRAIKQIDSILV